MKGESYLRGLGVLLLASPLALTLQQDGVAAVVLDPVALGGRLDYVRYSAGEDQLLSSFRIDAETNDGGSSFTATQIVSSGALANSYLETASSHYEYGGLAVENNRGYSLSGRATFQSPADITQELTVTRNNLEVPPEVGGEPNSHFEYDLAQITGQINVTGGTLQYFYLYAVGSNTAAQETYQTYFYRSGSNQFSLHAVPNTTSGTVRVYGNAWVRVQRDDGVFVTVRYSLSTQYHDLWNGAPVDATGLVWNINATPPATPPAGVTISGHVSSLLATGSSPVNFSSHYIYDQLTTSPLGMYSSVVAGPAANPYSLANRYAGTHRIYSASIWSNPSRYLRRPYVQRVLAENQNDVVNMTDPLGEIHAEISTGAFFSPTDFKDLYLSADGPANGYASAYAAADGSVSLPVTAGTWNPNHVYAYREVYGQIDSTFRAYDYSHNGVDVGGVAGYDVDEDTYTLDLVPTDVIFDIVNDPMGYYQIGSGEIIGHSATFPGCAETTDPRYITAYAVTGPASTHSVPLIAEPGCYLFSAWAVALYNDTPDPANTVQTDLYWENVPLEVAAGHCTVGEVCEVLPEVEVLFLLNETGETVTISVAETEVGPEPPTNFSYGPASESGSVAYYYLQVPDGVTDFEAEVCIRWDADDVALPPALQGPYQAALDAGDLDGASAIRQRFIDSFQLFHWGFDCEPYLSSGDRGWCAITSLGYPESEPDGSGRVCGTTDHFSPFAVFRYADIDEDGVDDDDDNCVLVANPSQDDTDGDTQGNACDGDDDDDGIGDADDVCPDVTDPEQNDADGDGIGDACADGDGDGVIDVEDNCPEDANPGQEDADANAVGDACEPSSCEGSCSAECPCDAGEGDCDDDSQCQPGLMCLYDAGPAFGYDDPELDVCSAVCPDIGVGAGNYCSPECPCDVGEGDCDDASECMPGLMCLRDAGVAFGYADPELDVCSAVCPDIGVGAGNYCSPECPCDAGEGDCDRTSDCASGLTCASNVGAAYGWPADTDVCEAP